MHLPKTLVWSTVALALTVIVLGAYVRLSDAGLGCPDWPGCYGRISPWHAAEHIEAAQAADPHGPVTYAKAWKEMVHRYLAGALGLAILTIATLSWLRLPLRQRWTPTLLIVLVIFQALLGMWTVTLQLKPVVVTAHLLGGMLTLALLVWLASGRRLAGAPTFKGLRLPARLLLTLVFIQIALGGWVSSHYAALACPDLPTCQGQWWPAMDFATAFGSLRPVGVDPPEVLTAIHMTHRLGALAVLATGIWLLARLWMVASLRPWAAALSVLLAAQILLGLANVLFSLPLPVAVAHNAGAALLLAALVLLNLRLSGSGDGSRDMPAPSASA